MKKFSSFPIALFIFAAFGVTAATQSHAAAEKPYTFTCPELLTDPADEDKANEEFINHAIKIGKGDVDQIMSLHMKMLIDNKCEKSLASIEDAKRQNAKIAEEKKATDVVAATVAATASNPTDPMTSATTQPVATTPAAATLSMVNPKARYACLGRDYMTTFSKSSEGTCSELALDFGWDNFITQPNIVIDIFLTTLVTDKDGSKRMWVKYYLDKPGTIENIKYNFVKSLNKFNCKKNEITMLQAIYMNNGKPVYKHPENESDSEEVVPGSLNFSLMKFVCAK